MERPKFYLVLLGLSHLQKNIEKICKEQKIKLVVFDKKPKQKKKNQFKANNKNFLELIKILKSHRLLEILKKKTSLAYCGSEFGLDAAHKLNLSFNSLFLNSYPDSKKFINKKYGTNFFKTNNINTPIRLNFTKALNFLKNEGEIILKPENLSGSKGVLMLSSIDGFKNNYKKYKKKYKKFICEEFVEGNGIDVQCYVKKKKLFKLGLGDRYFSKGKFKVPIHGNFPSILKKNVQNKVYGILNKLIKKTNFNNSFIKADFILDNKKKIFLLEVSPRLHGDVFSSNTIFYYDKKNAPLSIFFKHFFYNKPMRNIYHKKNKITVWHSLFFKKKLNRKNLNFVKSKIKALCKPHQIFLKDKIVSRKTHKDNTTIGGFFWFSVKPEKYKRTMINIQKNLNEYILCN